MKEAWTRENWRNSHGDAGPQASQAGTDAPAVERSTTGPKAVLERRLAVSYKRIAATMVFKREREGIITPAANIELHRE